MELYPPATGLQLRYQVYCWGYPGRGLTVEVLNRPMAQRDLKGRCDHTRSRAAAASAAATLIYIYTLSLPSERVMAVILALRLKRMSKRGPWLLGVSKAGRCCGRRRFYF